MNIGRSRERLFLWPEARGSWQTILKDFRLKDFMALAMPLQPLYLHRF
jgi:hypothetical protein